MVALALSALIGNMLFSASLVELLPAGAAVLLQFLCGLHLWLAGTVQLQPAALQHCSSSTDEQGRSFSFSCLFFGLFHDIDIAFVDKVSLLLSIICFFLVYIFTFVFARWRKTLHPERTSVGRWLLDEDKRLMVTVKLIGPSRWSLIAPFIPGRTQTQIFER